jgi:hypothetical protein
MTPSFAQVIPKDTSQYVYDTFFLAKKKGLFGKLGRSISQDPPKPELTKTGTIRNDLPYNRYKGYTIRQIDITSLEFDRSFEDTNRIKKNIGIRIANALHHTTRKKYIRYNLFFKPGDKVFPLLLADNERHLREQDYLQDARIIVTPVTGSSKEVDITVVTKDVFSIGGSADISSAQKGRITIKDEDFLGRAQRLQFSALYDKDRSDPSSFGFEYLQRNVFGSLAEWSLGFTGYNPAINSGQRQETYVYTRINKPLVSAYLPWTGGLEASYHQNKNAYTDSSYVSLKRYKFYNLDGWMGYNLGSHRLLYKNISTRLRKFIAVRGFRSEFQTIPGYYDNQYYFLYANLTGVLASLTLFKQNFYKTKYIYGFGGRYEDVPEGFNASFTSGWTDKNNRPRPYYGFDFSRYFFSKRGNYYNGTIKFGGFYLNRRFEDLSLLVNLDHFTKLKRLSSHWYNRNYFSVGATKQINPLLDEPLRLRSDFGIPIFNNGDVAANFRSTVKAESVFYNSWKLLGFRFAPFIFGDMALLTPVNKKFIKSDIYTSLGGGLRTRNESLVFGTLEVKAFYFPRLTPGMDPWRVEFSSNIRFRYISEFIKRPDFVRVN